MSTLNVSNISDGTDTVETGYVVNGSAKAWVNFNGLGTISINDSFNISSATDNGTGNYDVTFSNSFSSVSYSPAYTSDNFARYSSIQSASTFRHLSLNNSFAASDAGKIMSQHFGDLA
jgi:hypothetical protein